MAGRIGLKADGTFTLTLSKITGGMLPDIPLDA